MYLPSLLNTPSQQCFPCAFLWCSTHIISYYNTLCVCLIPLTHMLLRNRSVSSARPHCPDQGRFSEDSCRTNEGMSSLHMGPILSQILSVLSLRHPLSEDLSITYRRKAEGVWEVGDSSFRKEEMTVSALDSNCLDGALGSFSLLAHWGFMPHHWTVLNRNSFTGSFIVDFFSFLRL